VFKGDGTGGALGSSATANGVLYLNGTKKLTSGTALTFDGTNLGLGVTPSAWSSTYFRTLQFNSLGSYVSGTNATYSGTPYFFIGNNGYDDTGSGFKYTTTNAASQYVQVGGAHQWKNAPSGTAGNAITFTQAMTLDASGNLGVGTTSPASKLDVSSSGEIARFRTSTARGSGNGYFGLYDTTGRKGYYGYGASDDSLYISNEMNAPMLFLTNSVERARIDSSGNLLVGTTSVYSNAKLTISTGGTNGISSTHTSAGGYRYVANALSDGGTYYYHLFNANGTATGGITSNGTVTVYSTTSDYRLKTVVGAVTGQGARIDALEPIEYEWKSNGSRTRGFLAHKFQEVYAGSVTGTKDAVDADGNPVYQSMQAATSEVIADLVAEIQSLRKRLADAGI
jgi:hypothetical protein